MPIPMPPPPPPFVAPDLRPVVARDSAQLLFVRDLRGRVREAMLDHGLWIAAEGAPLEVRFHRRVDGSTWAEQATYAAGDRAGGIARVSASAHAQVLSRRVLGQMGELRSFVRYTVRDGAGRALRTWTSSHCGTAGAARLDRDGSPAEQTYPASWEGCGGFQGAYVLGRLTGLDRGWAMPAPSSVSGVAALAVGRYQLEIDVDPLDALADADRSNDVATVRLVVRSVRRRAAEPGPTLEPVFPGEEGPPAPTAGSIEPVWRWRELRSLERRVSAQLLVRTGQADGTAAAPPPADVDLPNLRSAPSYGIQTLSRRLRATGRRDYLLFGALTWNAGPGRLEVEAFRERGTTLQGYQVFYRDGERATRQARGTLVWHAAPGHHHFHFHAFASYQLTDLAGSVVRDGGKRSWCIVDTDVVDTTRPGVGSDRLARGFGEAGGCGSEPGALWARLSLSAGSGDYYGPGLSGQAFDITGLANGSYRIRIEANPSGVLAEADHGDNVSTRVVRLGGVPGARTVTARPDPTIDERGGIDCFEC